MSKMTEPEDFVLAMQDNPLHKELKLREVAAAARAMAGGRDSFFIEGPAVISFSGGRTSAYMLWRILQAHGGKLPDDVYVMFANTGKENKATLLFVRDIELYWGVKIYWVEYRPRLFSPPLLVEHWPKQHAIVDFETASREGEPFDILLQERKMLPNVRARFCRTELKYRTMHRVIAEFLGLDEWTAVIGIRADEMSRVGSLSIKDDPREEKIAPMVEAGIGNDTVLAFWKMQPFDLGLPVVDGKTLGGNCEYCFLKKGRTHVTLARQDPQSIAWWVQKEEWGKQWKAEGALSGDGDKFRNDRPALAAIQEFALNHDEMFPIDEDDIVDCGCGE